METLRATPYDADNLVHEQQLLQLWSLLQPGTVIQKKRNNLKYFQISINEFLHAAAWFLKKNDASFFEK